MSDQSQSSKPVRLFTPQEAAAFLSVSVRTIQRLIAARELSPVRSSKSMRFRIDDPLHFVDQNNCSLERHPENVNQRDSHET
jgi:excisionase family DNA binding protein